MLSIALTGGFGTGKTTVLHMFGKLGSRTVDIDSIVHNILKDTVIKKRIGKILGESVLDRSNNRISVNKRRVANIIFNDQQKRKSVEMLIHPLVLRNIWDIKKDTLRKEPSALIVFEVPLLFEAGYGKHFDKIVVVSCSRKTALKRLEKKGFFHDEAEKRMRAQLPMTLKKKEADFVIDNNNGTDKTEARVRRIFNKLKTSAVSTKSVNKSCKRFKWLSRKGSRGPGV